MTYHTICVVLSNVYFILVHLVRCKFLKHRNVLLLFTIVSIRKPLLVITVAIHGTAVFILMPRVVTCTAYV